MKKIILIPLLLISFFIKAQTPVNVSQPQKFLKYILGVGSIKTDSAMSTSDSSTRVPNTKWIKQNFAPVTGGGYVASVLGTTNRITSTGGTNPILNISPTFEALIVPYTGAIHDFDLASTGKGIYAEFAQIGHGSGTGAGLSASLFYNNSSTGTGVEIQAGDATHEGLYIQPYNLGAKTIQLFGDGHAIFAGPITGNLAGNATTVTNGVYTTTFNGLGDPRYQPLENQRLSTANNVTFNTLNLNGVLTGVGINIGSNVINAGNFQKAGYTGSNLLVDDGSSLPFSYFAHIPGNNIDIANSIVSSRQSTMLYNKAFFTSTSDFTTLTGSPSIVSNSIELSNAGIALNITPNSDENYEYEAIFQVATLGSNISLSRTGTQVYYNLSLVAQLNTSANTVTITVPGSGNIKVFSLPFTVAANDIIRMRLSQSQNIVTASVDDLTQGRSGSGSGIIKNINFYPTIGAITINCNSVMDLMSLKVTSTTNVNGDVLILGNSKVNGVTSGGLITRAASMMSNLGIVNVLGSGGAATADFVSQLPYLISLKPKTVILLELPRNDIDNSVPSATWQANYATIVSQLQAAGISVIHVIGLLENTLNQSASTTYITGAYPSGSIINLTSTFNTGTMLFDGVHPNNLGQRFIASSIIASGLLPVKNNFAISYRDYLPPNFDAPISAISPIFYNAGVISSQAATASINGYLTSDDWSIFNNKQSAITFGTGVQSALGVNVGLAGAPVLFNGAGGTPSSITLTNAGGTAPGLTAGNVTTNANQTGAVTSIGNTTSLGSFTSTNLRTALTDETGTGNAVFSAAPLLTGNVSIGTIGGFGNLNIKTASNALILIDGSAAATTALLFAQAGTETARIGNPGSSADLVFYRNGTTENGRFSNSTGAFSLATLTTGIVGSTGGVLGNITALPSGTTAATPSGSTDVANKAYVDGLARVTCVTSANSDIGVATGTSTPLLTFNRGENFAWTGNSTYAGTETFNGGIISTSSTDLNGVNLKGGFGAAFYNAGNTFSGLLYATVTANRSWLMPDASGTVALTTDVPIAGSFSGVGTATTTFTVTIGQTMANTTYKVNATPTNLLSAAVFYITNKTTTTFDVVYLAGLTGSVSFDWSVFR